MTDAETIRFIRQEIARAMNIILSGTAGSNSVDKEDIEQMFPGMPTVTQRPVMHPYGYASRAEKEPISVVGQQGEHIGNKMVLGHRDKNRPTDLQEGESAVYSKKFMQMRTGLEKATIGKSSDNTDGGFAGNSFVTVSDEAGNESTIMQHKTGASVQIDKDGSVIIAAKDGSYMFMDATSGALNVTSKDGCVVALSVDGVSIADKTGKQILSMDNTDLLQIVASSDVVISAPVVTVQGGTINLGEGAIFSNVIAELLEAYLDNYIVVALHNLGQNFVPFASAFNLNNPLLSWRSLYVKQRSNLV